MKRTRVIPLAIVALCTSVLSHGEEAEAQLLGNLPFMKSLDGSLSAAFVGPQCGPEVSFTFSGKDRATFNKDGIATRLMSNVVAAVRRTCPRVRLIAAKGLVAEDVVYNAVADGESGWLLLQLGGVRDGSILGAGARGAAGEQGRFARRPDFAAYGKVLAATRGHPYLCTSQQAGSCTSFSQFRDATDDGAIQVARSLLDGGGTQAVLTYSGKNQSGFLCANPQQARIEVINGAASAGARARMAVDLRERLRPYGNQVCSGYALRGSQIISANFDATGRRIGNEVILNAMPSEPRLRQDK